MDPSVRSSAVQHMCTLVSQYYVFPDIAEEINAVLRGPQAVRELTGSSTDEDFSAAVTTIIQSVNGDKHLRLLHSVDELPLADAGDAEAIEDAAYRREVTLSAGGIASAQRLEGNVGYLDIRVLHDANVAAPLASAAMTLVAGTDALLIDLRRCPGGSPLMVAHLCSYLFDDPTHLTDVYDRPSGETRQFWTAPWVPGEKFGEAKPIYVLVGSATFSGAEQFGYALQSRGRATIVGEPTGGGAHLGARHRIGPHLQLSVPQGRTINPVTGTDWEGSGLRPDVAVAADEAFDIAYELALEQVLSLGRAGVRRSVHEEAEAAQLRSI